MRIIIDKIDDLEKWEKIDSKNYILNFSIDSCTRFFIVMYIRECSNQLHK
ncbi:MAG: hypothetical protein ACPKPY_00255 [Nitrososphaeraceae archaeon]